MGHATLHAVAIAGGSGTRFWPVSRQARPKQLLNLSGEDTLLHGTFTRVANTIDKQRWWMVVGAHHADGCRACVPEISRPRALVEPEAKNTAPAIALAACHLDHVDGDATMVVLPADHHVADAPAFCRAVIKAAKIAESGRIVTLGIAPTHPETGFGYIQQGTPIDGFADAFCVARFVEKPDLRRAESFIKEGGYVWNAGIFIMRPKAYLDEIQRQLPELFDALQTIKGAIGSKNYEAILKQTYARIDGISIDYGVMERAQNACVVPVSCGWSDVGSWSALGSVVKADADNNVVRGRSILRDAHGSVTWADDGHVVGVIGMKDVVVVHTRDATLVAPKDRAQEVKEVLAAIATKGWREYL